MTEQDTQSAEHPQCTYFHFGLIITGETEQQHLPKLFKSLMETGICTFEVIRRVGQLGAITSAKRLRTCFKKKDTTQELMFTFNHWSSKILTQ